MVRVLINVPKRVKRGEAFDVKLLISHPMESGQRRDAMGQAIPRDIINSFVCTYNDEEVLRADLFPAIAANPFLSFAVTAQRERHAGDDVHRRPRRGADRDGEHHGRMIRRIALAALLVMAAAEKRSGYQDASPETRAMQDDDASNPGFLWVQQGEALWKERIGTAGRSCADCHGAAPVAMRGVAARYPLFDAHLGRPITLAQRIEQCRVERQGATPLPPDSDALLGLTAYVGLQSRGLPMQVAVDGPARPFYEAGKALFNMRAGPVQSRPARSVMTIWPGSAWPAASFRRGIRTAIRNIGWSGRAWARSNGASATAWWACAPSRSRRIRWNWPNWSFTWAGAPTASTWRRRRFGRDHHSPEGDHMNSAAAPLLFTPITLRGVTVRNRVVVSPMCQYVSVDGGPTDWQFVHFGRYAMGGAGIVFGEETAVEARGRKTYHCAGLWNDHQARAYRRITDFIKEMGAVPAIQLGHCGRNAGSHGAMEEWRALDERDARAGMPPWRGLAPSPLPARRGFPVPIEMDHDDIRNVLAAFRDAARRATDAGYDICEIHGAHGYLIHQFLSPVSNRRTDGMAGRARTACASHSRSPRRCARLAAGSAAVLPGLRGGRQGRALGPRRHGGAGARIARA